MKTVKLILNILYILSLISFTGLNFKVFSADVMKNTTGMMFSAGNPQWKEASKKRRRWSIVFVVISLIVFLLLIIFAEKIMALNTWWKIGILIGEGFLFSTIHKISVRIEGGSSGNNKNLEE